MQRAGALDALKDGDDVARVTLMARNASTSSAMVAPSARLTACASSSCTCTVASGAHTVRTPFERRRRCTPSGCETAKRSLIDTLRSPWRDVTADR